MPRKDELPGQGGLFPAADFETGGALTFKPLSERLWTRNKAQLIAKYLREFVFVTKHGTYIDLFSGRQNAAVEDSWSVQQVIEHQPTKFHLNNYWLFEKDEAKVRDLGALAVLHPGLAIEVHRPCDSNLAIPEVFTPGRLPEREATFCLIDQRTTECEWATVVHLSTMKPGRYKPELFYFLAQGWFNRALKTRSTPAKVDETNRWWGRDDWRPLLDVSAPERAQLVAARFVEELGYKTAVPWPIYDRKGGSTIMFHMIHATDHDRAPKLMRSAYEWAVSPKAMPSEEQLELLLGDIPYED